MGLKSYEKKIESEVYRFHISHKFQCIDNTWNHDVENLFLSRDYLNGIEHAAPKRCTLIYLVIEKENQYYGQAVFQTVVLDGKNDFKPEEHLNNKKQGTLGRAFNYLSKGLIQRTKLNILIAGNMMNVGTNFFHFADLERIDQILFLDQMIQQTNIYLKEIKGIKYNTSLIKELKKNEENQGIIALKEQGYLPFEVEPNMLINIRWKDFESYLGDMKSKYRVRYKRATKKLKDLRSVEFSLEQIIEYKSEMFDLYNTIASQAQFNLVDLNTEYHVSLKKTLGEKYKVFAYFDLNKNLLGFYTLIINGKSIDAGYLGLKKTANKEYQLYLNMLYDMLRKSIQSDVEKLVLARTALEIKSSIGAVPEEKILFLKNQKSLYHWIISKILKTLNRPTEWTQRRPFNEKKQGK